MAKLDKGKRQAARQGLLIVVVALLTVQVTGLLQFVYAKYTVTQEANRRAEGQLEATELHILGVMDQVETAVRNAVWSVQQQLQRPDSLAAITWRMVENNRTQRRYCGLKTRLSAADQ